MGLKSYFGRQGADDERTDERERVRNAPQIPTAIALNDAGMDDVEDVNLPAGFEKRIRADADRLGATADEDVATPPADEASAPASGPVSDPPDSIRRFPLRPDDVEQPTKSPVIPDDVEEKHEKGIDYIWTPGKGLPTVEEQERERAKMRGTPESRMAEYMRSRPDDFVEGAADSIEQNKIGSSPNRDPFVPFDFKAPPPMAEAPEAADPWNGADPGEMAPALRGAVTKAEAPAAPPAPSEAKPTAPAAAPATAQLDRAGLLRRAAEETLKRRQAGDEQAWLARSAEHIGAALARRKPDDWAANVVDARTQRDAALPGQLAQATISSEDAERKRRLDEAAIALRNKQLNQPHTNDSLETAKFNKQWEIDHPKAPEAPKPGLTQAQVDEKFGADLAKIKAQTNRANRPPVAAGGGPAGVDSDAVKIGTDLYFATGALPERIPPPLKTAILVEAYRRDPDAATKIAQAAASYGGEKKAVGQQAQRGASIETSTQALDNTLETVIANTEAVKQRSGLPFLDEYGIAAQAGLGNVPAQNLLESIRAAQAEYARILSMSPSGAGAPFAENMKRAEKVIHAGMTPDQLRGVSKQIAAINAGVNKAATDVGAQHLGKIGTQAPAPAAGLPPVPAGHTRLRSPDGEIEDVPNANVAAALADRYERI